MSDRPSPSGWITEGKAGCPMMLIRRRNGRHDGLCHALATWRERFDLAPSSHLPISIGVQVMTRGLAHRADRKTRIFAGPEDDAGGRDVRCLAVTLPGDERERGRTLPWQCSRVHAGMVLIMDLKLTDKVAVVTGASKGIGLAIAKAFVAEGARVVAGARNVESLRGLEGVTPVALDLTTVEGPRALIERALGEHGRVDVLVNNVGAVRIRLEGFLGTSDEEFEWAMQVNFFSTLRATRAALVPMLMQGGGAIVNIASVNAFFQPDAGTIDYGAAKAAVINLTKALAQEFGPRGIHVNAISPGPVSTDLWLGTGGVADTVAKLTGVDADTARKNVVASIGGFATGRFTTPEEVATLAVLLASERTANVTGANYVIDGGLIKTT
jgi:NAD(P)-dependent dehydrogenase (short-subunit alcohol dehydrogenase family)